jgi:paraquat-inducible protein B
VALDFFPSAQRASVDVGPSSPPRLPTQRGSLDELQSMLLRIVTRLDKLPLDEIGRDTRIAIAGLGRTIDVPKALITRLDGLAAKSATVLRDTVVEARAAIADTRKLLADDAPVQQDLRASAAGTDPRRRGAAPSGRYDLDRHPEALLRGKPEERPERGGGAGGCAGQH